MPVRLMNVSSRVASAGVWTSLLLAVCSAALRPQTALLAASSPAWQDRRAFNDCLPSACVPPCSLLLLSVPPGSSECSSIHQCLCLSLRVSSPSSEQLCSHHVAHPSKPPLVSLLPRRLPLATRHCFTAIWSSFNQCTLHAPLNLKA